MRRGTRLVLYRWSRRCGQEAERACNEWVDVHRFPRQLRLGIAIHPATPLGLADEGPVRRLVASAGMPIGVDKRLQEVGLVSIELLPVLGEALRREGQQPRRQVLHLDPGEEQVSGVVDDIAEVALALLGRPADPKLWKVFDDLQQAGIANQEKLAHFVASRCLALPSDENCIDTVRMSLLQTPVLKDRPHLQKLGFALGKNRHYARKLPDGSLADPDHGSELWQRSSDDCRVQLWPSTEHEGGKCAIEVSVPRVLGVPNYRVHELIQSDVQHVFEILIESLLPWATSVADVLDRQWAIVRLDAARDFAGDAAEYADAHAFTRWPRVNKPPFPRRMKNGLWWTPASKSQRPHQLRLYDKGRQMTDTAKSAEDFAALVDAPAPGEVVRVERQWTGKAGLPALRKALEGAGSGIRVGGRLLQVVDREIPGNTVAIEMSLSALHAVLAWEIGLLGHQQVKASSRQEALAWAYIRDPIFRNDFETFWGKTSIKKMRKLAAQLQSGGAGFDLLTACYGAQGAHAK